MQRPTRIVIVTFLGVAVLLTAAALAYVKVTGLSARPRPGALEARVARAVRSLAVPGEVKSRTNPVAASREVLESGMAHFADHCAMCHANDGSGSVEMGQHLFPPPPDMRAEPTQALTDGELFYIIENGVRFTGMPAFATGDAEGERASWELVRFVRSLPTLSADDVARMETMNPRPPDEIRREIEDEQFLQGGSVAPARGSEAGHKGAH